MRSIVLAVLAALALVIAPTALGSPTAVSGHQVFTDLGTTTANGSSTGNIATATHIMFGDWSTTTDSSGVFTGLPIQMFGPVSFTDTTGTSLDFGNSVFGTFKSTSITKQPSSAGFADFLIEGMFTTGSFESVSGTFPAEVRVSLTQTSSSNGLISASGTETFSMVTPEPSTALLGGLGLMLLFLPSSVRRLRRVKQ